MNREAIHSSTASTDSSLADLFQEHYIRLEKILKSIFRQRHIYPWDSEQISKRVTVRLKNLPSSSSAVYFVDKEIVLATEVFFMLSKPAFDYKFPSSLWSLEALNQFGIVVQGNRFENGKTN